MARVNIQRVTDAGDPLNMAESGRSPDGERLFLDRRLYMQLLVFAGNANGNELITSLEQNGRGGVLYADLSNPYGFGLLMFSEEASDFLTGWRQFLLKPPFNRLELKPEFTMTGRTYAIGYEHNLKRVLLERPVEQVCHPDLPWAVWYPVRRSGKFERLPADEQRQILMEHGGVGRAYGEAGLAHDIRLACYGLDKNDNDFVIGLLGPDLHPLSKIVERMRKTRQTSEYLENLGPFFIGHAVWQQPQRGKA